MTRKLRLLPFAALCFFPSFAQADSVPETLKHYAELCSINRNCSSEMSDRGLMIKLSRSGQTMNILCRESGGCTKLFSKGRWTKVSDILALLGG